jgi:crotonobetainyl-CoA:carnitine CoA-transferase CaiB-like acyl-CoA transferase
VNALPLSGLRVFDLTRILAGPSCTQILGDLGADVIKIERAGAGDDTRKWGPPYLKDAEGKDTSESAYYLAINRNKRSVSLDLSKPDGQALAKKLIAKCDVLIENFKVGDLAKYGLGYEQLKSQFPRLVYCSITGFGQTGPYAPRAGYDMLAQGMGGIMSITGQPEGRPGSEPMKVGIGITDLMAGLYTAVAMLSALRHRDATGRGQQIDVALLDTQVAWLVYEGMNYLVGGQLPTRRGNGHPNIVPYNVFPCADGHIILGIGNDGQFRKFCEFAGHAAMADDPRFRTNPQRLANRDACDAAVGAITKTKARQHWLDGLAAAGVPCSPVNTIDQVFADPQVIAREMVAKMQHAKAGVEIPVIASPIKMSETPPAYRRAPPVCGQDTDDVLHELLGMSAADVDALRARGVV